MNIARRMAPQLGRDQSLTLQVKNQIFNLDPRHSFYGKGSRQINKISKAVHSLATNDLAVSYHVLKSHDDVQSGNGMHQGILSAKHPS